MYDQDSFFDLSPLGQVGLACLSLTMFVLAFAIVRLALRHRPVWMRIVGSLAVLWLFVWLSPQVYYMYYRVLLVDLPLQWVIKVPKGLLHLAELLTFQGRQNLAAHGQGIMGWLLIAAPFLPLTRKEPRETK